MKKILETLKSELERGGKAVLCTVIDNRGACPRGKGAHMLVSEKSKTIGAVVGEETGLIAVVGPKAEIASGDKVAAGVQIDADAQ